MFVSRGTLVTKTPIGPTSSYFYGMPPMSSPSWPSAYGAIYRQHLWVYVVVNKRANAVARLPLPVYERDELNRPKAEGHPMAALLSAPNPGMSGFDLWTWTVSTRDIYGRAFWLKKRSRGTVVGLYPLHPTSMTWQPAKRSWRFDNGTLRLEDVSPDDLVRFGTYNPDSDDGLSPLEPLRSTLENEWHARTATSSFWARGARPGMALVHPMTLSQQAADRLKSQFDGIAAGSGSTGATVVLEEGMKPEVMALTAEESQYIETRKLNREEVCGAYDIPPPVVHILDRATFSNITEQMRSMYRDTMAPVLRGLESAIELDLRRAEWPNDAVYAEFLMDEVLRGDFESRQDALAKASHMTLAEKRKVENLPFIDGTDRIFLNTATLPLDAIDAQSAAVIAATARTPVTRAIGLVETKARGSESQVEHARAVLADFFTRQGEAVGAGWDDARWDAELGDELYAVNVLVATATGRKTLESLGLDTDGYDQARTLAWLRANADGVAAGINGRTKAEVADALTEPDPNAALAALFAGYVASRAAQIAETHVTALSGFGTTEAARQTGQPTTKTWVTGGNPRSSHAALNGQTVDIDEPFSNGAMWPGDNNLTPDERAGCNCTVTISLGKGLSTAQSRTVMGRLAWQKSLDQVDPAVLVDGLNGSSGPVLDALAKAENVPDLRDRIRALVKE